MILDMSKAPEPGVARPRAPRLFAAARALSWLSFLLVLVLSAGSCKKDELALTTAQRVDALADKIVSSATEGAGIDDAQLDFFVEAPELRVVMQELAVVYGSQRMDPQTAKKFDEIRGGAADKVANLQIALQAKAKEDAAYAEKLDKLISDFNELALMNQTPAPWETLTPWATLPQASTFASGTDLLYLFIVGLSVFFFALVMGVQGWFMWKYRRRSEDQKTSSISHNGKVEFLWSAIPAVLLVVIFIWGEVDYLKQTIPPSDAIQVRVVGRQWFWSVDYPDYPGVQFSSSTEDNAITMVVPKGRPVQLTMTSEDVLHDLYIPAFRVKRDVVPGRYTTLWFEASQVGEFNLYCAEYCSDQHSAMIGRIKVLEPENFVAYLSDAGKLKQEDGETPAQFGKRIYERRGCNACHSVDGSPKVGPSWKGIWARSESTDKGPVTVDDNYITESIYEPNAKIVSGYEGVKMPSYKGQLDTTHIQALIEYMKTLK